MKAWVVVALSLMPGLAWAQTAEFKCPKPGTVVQYSDGSVSEWVSQGQNSCRMTSKAPNADAQSNDWYAPFASVPTNSGNGQAWLQQTKPWTLWPLAVGKKIAARYDGASNNGTEHGSWTFTFTVDRYERVNTQAGSFDAFVVTRTQESIGRPFKQKWIQWYAPELGIAVRLDTSDNQGRSNKRGAIAIKSQ